MPQRVTGSQYGRALDRHADAIARLCERLDVALRADDRALEVALECAIDRRYACGAAIMEEITPC